MVVPFGRKRGTVMKNLHLTHLGIGAALLMLCACSPGERDANAGAGNAAAPVNGAEGQADRPEAPASPPKGDGKGVSMDRRDEALEFSYGWPAEAAAIAPLDAWLRSHAEDQYRKAMTEAKQGQDSAKKDSYPFRRYSFEQKWEKVADLPGVLVMESNGYSYTGGAHGMPFVTSLIWDREAGKRHGTGDVLDKVKLTSASRAAFCKELDRQRVEKRGQPVDPDAKDGIAEFNQCPAMGEQEILPISRKGKALDAIRVVIGPYVAGPYAEGSYEIDLPLTDAMLAAVKQPYRGWFSTGTP